MTLFFNLKHFFDIVLKSLNLIYRPTTNKIHFRLLPEIRWLYINNLPVGLHAISTVHVLCGTNIDQLSQLIYTRPYWILQATHSRSATTASSPALNGVTLCIVLAAQPGWDSLRYHRWLLYQRAPRFSRFWGWRPPVASPSTSRPVWRSFPETALS